jgi:hypothetical protein
MSEEEALAFIESVPAQNQSSDKKKKKKGKK